ncbi:MAG: hypothetical protein U1E17_09050 [Geminicoccaceae bacterium]
MRRGEWGSLLHGQLHETVGVVGFQGGGRWRAFHGLALPRLQHGRAVADPAAEEADTVARLGYRVDGS